MSKSRRRKPKKKRSSRHLALINLVSGAVLLGLGLVILTASVTVVAATRPGLLLLAGILILEGWTFARVAGTYLRDVRRRDAQLAAAAPVVAPAPGGDVDAADICPRCGDLATAAERVPLPDGLALCHRCLRAAGGADYVAWLQANPHPEEQNTPGLAAFLSLARFEAGLLAILALGTAADFTMASTGSTALTPAFLGAFAVYGCAGLIGCAGLLMILRLLLLSARVSLEPDRIQTHLGRRATRSLAYEDIEGILPEQRIAYGSRARMLYVSWPEGYHPALRIHFHGEHAAFMVTTVQLIFEQRTMALAAAIPARGAAPDS